jgi:hypothetical protein
MKKTKKGHKDKQDEDEQEEDEQEEDTQERDKQKPEEPRRTRDGKWDVSELLRPANTLTRPGRRQEL